MSNGTTQPPAPPVAAQADDAGIAAWREQLLEGIGRQPGVEMIGASGGSFSFRFRGQEFTVSIRRTA